MPADAQAGWPRTPWEGRGARLRVGSVFVGVGGVKPGAGPSHRSPARHVEPVLVERRLLAVEQVSGEQRDPPGGVSQMSPRTGRTSRPFACVGQFVETVTEASSHPGVAAGEHGPDLAGADEPAAPVTRIFIRTSALYCGHLELVCTRRSWRGRDFRVVADQERLDAAHTADEAPDSRNENSISLDRRCTRPRSC
jgi:hypothetical protein